MDLKIDQTTGDLDLSSGTPVLVDGIDAIAQHLSIRLKFFKGEWFLDTRLGVPYYQEILGQNRRQNLIDAIFRQVILQTPGVTALRSFSQSFNAALRKLSISFVAETKDGPIEFTDLFIVVIPV